jgi:hypothetical protein
MAKVVISLEGVGDAVSLSFVGKGPGTGKAEMTPAQHVGTHALLAIRRMLSQLAADEGTVLQHAEAARCEH